MLNQRKEYSRYYGGFRGVDFATDHTLVADSRFPYAVNMYKDYVSGAGQGIETIPGFRIRCDAVSGRHEGSTRVNAIHAFVDSDGKTRPLLHVGTYLYEELNGFADANDMFALRPLTSFLNDRESVSFTFNNRFYILDGKNYLVYDGKTLSNVKDNAYIPTTYINIIPAGENADSGTEYEQRNMLSPYFKHTFIPVTYKDDDENEVVSKVFVMNEQNLDAIVSVKVYGTELAADAYTVDLEKGEITLNEAPGKPEDNGYPEFYAGVEITAKKAVYEAKDVKIKRADGSETTLSAYRGDTADHFVSMIESATIAMTFDNRVFFSGIPGKPNLVLYCGRNTTGYADPSYIGILNYVEDGVGTTPITAMLGVAGTLLVLKADTQQDGSVYYHTPTETGENILPKIYPSTAGLAGTGCLGAALNFLDDPVFISKRGLEAVSQLKIASERSIEHRSSLVDPKLIGTDLAKAKLCEWGGYLILLAEGGKIFMADSRQVYQNALGHVEYEWYYLEDIGDYDGGTSLDVNTRNDFIFVQDYPTILIDKSGNRVVNTVKYDGADVECNALFDVPVNNRPTIDKLKDALEICEERIVAANGFVVHYSYAVLSNDEGGYTAFLLDTTGGRVGVGNFCPATAIANINGNLFFGTSTGCVYSFNFDKRDEDGLIPEMYYSFDGIPIFSGLALKMDNCGFPNMTKSTKKRTTVIKTKNFYSSAAKIRVRTNENPYKEIEKISTKRFSFDELNFSDFSFLSEERSLFSIIEKEKKWVEKQYFIYSDEYRKPFSLYYLTYNYVVIGKYK